MKHAINVWTYNYVDLYFLIDVVALKYRSAEIFLYNINQENKGFFSIWNQHKCLSYLFEYLCYGSTVSINV